MRALVYARRTDGFLGCLRGLLALLNALREGLADLLVQLDVGKLLSSGDGLKTYSVSRLLDRLRHGLAGDGSRVQGARRARDSARSSSSELEHDDGCRKQVR